LFECEEFEVVEPFYFLITLELQSCYICQVIVGISFSQITSLLRTNRRARVCHYSNNLPRVVQLEHTRSSESSSFHNCAFLEISSIYVLFFALFSK
jgi:hypothetical protein